MKTDTKSATAEGLPTPYRYETQELPGESYSDRWMRTFAYEVAIFASVRIDDLKDIYDALVHGSDAMSGQWSDIDSPIGALTHEVQRELDGLKTALIEHIKTRTPVDWEEFNAFSQLLLRYEAECEGDPRQTLELILEIERKRPVGVGRAA